jgi:hypothetical protein
MAVLLSLCHMLKRVELGRLLPSVMVTGPTCKLLSCRVRAAAGYIEDAVVVF